MTGINSRFNHTLSRLLRSASPHTINQARVSPAVSTEPNRRIQELEAQVQELSAFNHTIAHDLKSPLTEFQAYLGLLNESCEHTHLSNAQQQYLAKLGQAAENMTSMIDQMLFLARLENSDVTMMPVNMKFAAETVLTRNQRLLAERRIKTTIEGNLPRALAHPTWVDQIFSNLIGNAIKYMGDENSTISEKSIIISATLQDGFARYEITDTGVGIAQQDQARLFEIFTRAENTKAVSGSGIGLSIVQRIVTRLGGQVGVTSEPGQGSTFWFTLPHPDTLRDMESD